METSDRTAPRAGQIVDQAGVILIGRSAIRIPERGERGRKAVNALVAETTSNWMW